MSLSKCLQPKFFSRIYYHIDKSDDRYMIVLVWWYKSLLAKNVFAVREEQVIFEYMEVGSCAESLKLD